MVYVVSKTGKNLMPTNRHGRVRKLIRDGKAKVICLNPFTIQLLFDTTEFTQLVKVGIDVGDTVGYAVTVDNNTVIDKGEISLRTDVSGLLQIRKTLRRGRRNRKTRYRKARFLNRGIPDGWLAPSIESKFGRIIDKINEITKYLPDYKLTVETMKFDTQKMENPDISGKEYQQGSLYGYENVKQYLLFREKGKCQICHKGYDKADKWHVHHIKHRSQGGTNRPSNLALTHESCHKELHRKNLKIKKTSIKRLTECAHFNSLRLRLKDMLKETYGDKVSFTYGYITKINRERLNLPKTHYNDAIAITGITDIKKDINEITVIKQVRKKKRSMHEATARKGRNKPNTDSIRNKKNTKEITVHGRKYALWDKVKVGNKKGYITGFTGNACYVQDIDGNYIKPDGKPYKQVSVNNIKHIRRNNNWITERKAA